MAARVTHAVVLRIAVTTALLYACARDRNLNEGPGCEGYRRINGIVLLFDDTVPGADPGTFRCLANEYGADEKHVFFGDRRMEGIDPASFNVLPHGYSKDRDHVFFGYYTGDSIPGADPASFQVIDLSFSKDSGRVYYWDPSGSAVNVFAADPPTFRQVGAFYRDRHHLFAATGEVLLALDTTDVELLRMICPEGWP